MVTGPSFSLAMEAEKNRGESLEARQFILQPQTGDSGMVVPDGTGSKMKVKKTVESLFEKQYGFLAPPCSTQVNGCSRPSPENQWLRR